MTKIISVFLVTFVFYLSFSAFGKLTDAEVKKKQIELIENDLKAEKEKYLRYDVKEKDILEQLAHIETEISEKRKILAELESEINIRKTELRAQQKNLDKIESELNLIEEQFGQRMVAFYKNAKRGYLRVLLSTEDLNLLNHYMKYLRVIMHEDREAMSALGEHRSEYSRQVADTKGQFETVSRLEEAENQILGELKQALEKEVHLLALFHN